MLSVREVAVAVAVALLCVIFQLREEIGRAHV